MLNTLGKKYNGRFEYIFDVGKNRPNSDRGDEVGVLIQELSVKEITLHKAQNIVSSITLILLNKYFENIDEKNIILIPILRSGLAMWSVANKFFNSPESTFPICHKDKGTSNVFIMWPARPNLEGKEIIILDTVIASGDTINVLCSYIEKLYPNSGIKITVLSCYVSPDAVDTVFNNSKINKLIIGGLSETVDKYGYLIPPTHGDIGDKLFGNKNVDFMRDLRVDSVQTIFL